jgi:hypothetical protein
LLSRLSGNIRLPTSACNAPAQFLAPDVSSGRERILMVISQTQEQRGELLTLVVNWTAGLAH